MTYPKPYSIYLRGTIVPNPTPNSKTLSPKPKLNPYVSRSQVEFNARFVLLADSEGKLEV